MTMYGAPELSECDQLPTRATSHRNQAENMADESTESPAQRSARLRREKRNAKIQSEGTDRLARITQVSGRPAPAPEERMSARTI